MLGWTFSIATRTMCDGRGTSLPGCRDTKRVSEGAVCICRPPKLSGPSFLSGGGRKVFLPTKTLNRTACNRSETPHRALRAFACRKASPFASTPLNFTSFAEARAVHRYARRLLSQIEAGMIDPSYIITHRVTLDEVPEAYRTFNDKEEDCLKIEIGRAHV